MFPAFLAAFLISICSFSGALVLVFTSHVLKKILIFLVALAAGTMMTGGIVHLLPEAIEGFPEGSFLPYYLLLFGFGLFFILERFILWHHCHTTKECGVHPMGYMNLFGDGLHNFLDGLVLAASFGVSFEVGIATTIAIVIHEIPQEISDFGVLIHSGMSHGKALFFNFLSAVFAIFGVLLGSYLQGSMEFFTPFLLAFTAGGFVYISATDLVPELHKEEDLKKASFSFFVFLIGVGIMIFLKFLEVE